MFSKAFKISTHEDSPKADDESFNSIYVVDR